MDDETQALIDTFKRPDGAIDWYRVLDIPYSATREQIRDSFAILSATYGPGPEAQSKENVVRHVLIKQAFAELDDPAKRKKYDAFLRHQKNHARLLVTIEQERQKQLIEKATARSSHSFVQLINRKVNSRFKRISLVLFPFAGSVALFRLVQDLDDYSWEPSLLFLLFSLASVLCLLIAFTGVGDWLADRHEPRSWLDEHKLGAEEKAPEILYYRSIDSFVRSVGYYEPLLELQGTDEEYCKAVMQAHKAAYLANVPDKIAGALTLDSVKHYYQNRDFALAFLRKLESRWLAESNGGASLVSDSTDHEGAEDIDNFHPSLDKVVELVRNFFAGGSMSSIFSSSNGLPLNLRAELVAYAATYIAMNKSGRKMPSGCWNTFKRAIENRMLSIADDGSQRSGTIQTPNGLAFAHFTSSYWAEMDTIDELADNEFSSNKRSGRELSSHLLHILGGNSEYESAFGKFFSSLVEFASKSIFPKVERAFG